MDKSSALVTFEEYQELEAQLLGLRRSCVVSRTQRVNEVIDKEVKKIGRRLLNAII
jgi:hypothetical protein